MRQRAAISDYKFMISPDPLDADNNLLQHHPKLWRLKGHLETSEFVGGKNNHQEIFMLYPGVMK